MSITSPSSASAAPSSNPPRPRLSSFSPPARDAASFAAIRASQLFARTPAAWQRLAPLLPIEVSALGDQPDAIALEFEMQAPQWNDWLASDAADIPAEERPSRNDLFIAHTPYGDWYAFRKSDSLLPADSRIVRWDHETTSISEESSTVAALAAHIVSACDQNRSNQCPEPTLSRSPHVRRQAIPLRLRNHRHRRHHARAAARNRGQRLQLGPRLRKAH